MLLAGSATADPSLPEPGSSEPNSSESSSKPKSSESSSKGWELAPKGSSPFDDGAPGEPVYEPATLETTPLDPVPVSPPNAAAETPSEEIDELRDEIAATEAALWEALQSGEVSIQADGEGAGDAGLPDAVSAARRDPPSDYSLTAGAAALRPLAPLLFAPLADARARERARADRAAADGDFGFAFDRAAQLAWEAQYWLELGQLEQAKGAIESAIELDPGNVGAWHLLGRLGLLLDEPGTLRDATRAVSRLLASGPVVPTPNRSLSPNVSAASSAQWLPAGWRAWLPEWARTGDGSLAGLLIAGVSLLLVAGDRLRRRGDLSIFIEYPAEFAGTFTVELHRSERSARSVEQRPSAAILAGRTSTRWTHNLVKRETRFGGVPTGRYHLVIDGVMLDPGSREVLARSFIVKEVEIVHERTVRESFDVTPEGCPVDVEVHWDGEPTEARVAVLGIGAKPLFASAGRTRVHVPKGEHIVAAGAADRVVERRVRMASYLPAEVTLELAGAEAPVFKACPPAVEPYLRGDYEKAAAALEIDGQTGAAHRLRATLMRKSGELARAAQHFEAAGDFVEAAEIHAERGDEARAGELYEQAGEWLAAAEMFQRAGNAVRAGGAYEAARDFDRAIDCYRGAQETGRWLDVLERRGELFEAGRIALHGSHRARGIRLLQRVPPGDAHYAEACGLLADEFEREDHWDLAAAKLADAIEARRPVESSSDEYARLADLHERAGQLQHALDVLEGLRQRDPGYPGVAVRVEELRKARSAKRVAEFASSSSFTDREVDQAQTVLLEETRYEIGEEIGRGGMGVVYRARDTRLGRIVALKKLCETQRNTLSTVQLFLREAQAAASLNHPNIVTVFDADQENGRLFFTMELLEGWSLPAVLSRQGPLAPAELSRIGIQVCRGLEYAHNRGIVHRDVKSANLFLTTDQVVKIMDFGLARTIEKIRSGTTVVGGTPYYMAPEQIDGEVDHRADLYSLGATFFELATGRVPFPEGDAAYHNRHTEAPDPRSLNPELCDELADLILDMLQKAPDDRPQSAAEIGLRLEGIAALEAQSADDQAETHVVLPSEGGRDA